MGDLSSESSCDGGWICETSGVVGRPAVLVVDMVSTILGVDMMDTGVIGERSCISCHCPYPVASASGLICCGVVQVAPDRFCALPLDPCHWSTGSSLTP